MRKNATKIAAMVLSLALTVTSVNVPTTSSAAAKVKLNKSKVTLTVGKTTKLVAKVNGKKVKATFTSSNAKVAKVAKTTGKVTAKKKGTAKITAKYNGKKAVCKVTVKAKATPTAEPTVEPTAEPTVEPTVAPTAEPTVEPTMEPTMAPVIKKDAANIEATLVNPFDAAHIDTVLIGTNAEVKVKVTDEDGNPVANESVIMTYDGVLDDGNDYAFENKTDTVLKTDDKGYATYVFGTKKSFDLDATDADWVTNLKLTASVAGTSIKTSTNLKFAAITFSKLDVLNENIYDWDAYKGPWPGTNKGGEYYETISGTVAADQKLYTEYVNSNQVSASDADHAITLSSGAYLVMPGVENMNTASEIVETVNYNSGKYGVYGANAGYKEVVIKNAKASELQYATVNFDNINLSRYTNMKIKAFIVSNPDDPWASITSNENERWDNILEPREIDLGTNGVIEGKKNLTNYAVQIPLDDDKQGYLFVVAKIFSQGQVDTDNNNGFVLRDIVGVYNPTTMHSDGDNEPISGVTINWAKNEKVMYELPIALTGTDALTKHVFDKLNVEYNPNGNEGYTFEYSVPAFPYTGNAVITVYDANKKAFAYWAIPTTNQSKRVNGDLVGYRNKNVLVNTVADLYQISENEAKNINVGTVETDADGNAKVNSFATGVTHVIGTIVSTNPNVVIDASNNKLYSSVQWNPIPNLDPHVPRTAGAALVGQTITLNAQLADRNSNPVKTAGVSVKFYYGDTEIKEGDILGGDKNYNFGATVEVITCDNVTDASGKAKLVVTAANVAALIGLSAEAADNKYTLAYTLGSETVVADFVDLYWVDANLEFVSSANADSEKITTSKDAPYKDVDERADETKIIAPTAGSNWEYGVYAFSGKSGNPWWIDDDGKLSGYYAAEMSGLTINTTVGDGSVGTVTNAANGKANATSKQAGTTFIENVLDSSSVTKDVTFTFRHKDNWGNAIVLPNIGEGTPNLDKKLTLHVNWVAADATASIIIPTGSKGAAGVNKQVFVKAVDAFGNPLKKDETTGVEVTLTANGKTQTAITNAETGIATFTVTGGDAGTSTTVVAKVTGIKNLTVSKSIKWVTPNATILKIESAEYDYSTKAVTIKFSDYVEKSSVVKEMFTVMYGDGAAAKKQIISDLKVSGKTVTFTLPALVNLDKSTEFTVSIETDVTVNGISYTLAATDGEVVTSIITTPDVNEDGTPDNITVK